MNKTQSKLCLLFAVLLCLAGLVPAPAEGESVDYAGKISLNFATETAKQEVTVKTYVDGDTTHFFVPETVMEGGVLKARYLGINTPESTGMIEEYGKRAAVFTRDKLENAVSIVIESDSPTWDKDSTGDRYLVWVWYRTDETQPYRNLNIEILQNGLALPYSAAGNRYGDLCMDAVAQAKAEKLSIHSGQKDPDFYYGDAIELTLKELRCNLEAYEGKKVAFEGIITINDGNSVYVEKYDAEQDMYFGISVYYGFGLSAKGLDILSVGNECRIVGTVQYYEAGNTWQVSGLSYDMMEPKHPGNIQKLSDGHKPAYFPVCADTFLHGKVLIQNEESSKTYDFAPLAMATSVSMENLQVKSIHTTQDTGSDNNGAMTLTCLCGGETVLVRTVPLRENGKLITEEKYLGKVIDVMGIVDLYEGNYQIKVFTPNRIIIHPENN